MCLIVKERYDSRSEAKAAAEKPLIAKKDIEVYKVVRQVSSRYYISPFQNAVYERGYHYYITNKKIFSSHISTWGSKWNVSIERGFHFLVSKSHARRFKKGNFMTRNTVIRKMIIPKGAKYFLGIDGEIVSSDVIFY